jgi:hypothetical protein
VHCNKHQTRPHTDHFKRLLEEAYPNHAYPIKHKLKDCDMMRSFMISGSPTQGTKLNEDLGKSDTMPFLEEDAIITVYGGRPPPRRRRVSNLIHGAPTHCGWGHGAHGCNGTSFPVSLCVCVCVCVCVKMYITVAPRDKRKKE